MAAAARATPAAPPRLASSWSQTGRPAPLSQSSHQNRSTAQKKAHLAFRRLPFAQANSRV